MSGADTSSTLSNSFLAFVNKRSLAGPAVTRTDVHVVAIAPPFSGPEAALYPDISDQSGRMNSATPTIQIIESDNGRHEVMWDEIPPKYDASTQRRRSSAGQALESVSPSSTTLGRANARLTEWSSTWRTPCSDQGPKVIVFPDQGSRKHHPECPVVDTRILASPNSKDISAAESHAPGAGTSYSPTEDGSISSSSRHADSMQDFSTPTDDSSLKLSSTLWSNWLVSARQKLGETSPERKFSSVDELNFRGHRDSVTLAHSRLGKSSELG